MTLGSLINLATLAGFPDPRLAAAVAMAESGGDPFALGDAGQSFGLWQVNLPAHPEWRGREQELFDPMTNARAALAISRGGVSWHPWSTFNSGAYRKYLGSDA